MSGWQGLRPTVVSLDDDDDRLAREPALRAFVRRMRGEPDPQPEQLTDEQLEHRQRTGFWVV